MAEISWTALVSPHIQFPRNKTSDINMLPVVLADPVKKKYTKKEKPFLFPVRSIYPPERRRRNPSSVKKLKVHHQAMIVISMLWGTFIFSSKIDK